jgi:hypothetical protein
MKSRKALIAALVAVFVLSSPAAAREPGAVVVEVHNGLISLEATEAAWIDVIVELTRKTGIVVHVAAVPAEPLTASFTRVEPEKVLPRLFGPSGGYAFVYASGPMPVAVWVASPAPTFSATPNSSAMMPIPADLRDADPKTRISTVDQLTSVQGDPAIDALARLVVTDPDADVRSAAATGLVRIGTPRAFAAARPAVFDEAKLVRLRTIEALADQGGESAHRILREALRDNDEEVRDAAAAGIPSAEVANATHSMGLGR